ncbi:hypothetical protein [Mycolicibacterium peregrinum]|uniref:hypothetical protein n=1 Tax=Mycolicibacterium peregrinum TaxID=43304 RepID=UPI0010421AC7|nr:hypothetical protein [Mycolicibacterium peregrinum]
MTSDLSLLGEGRLIRDNPATALSEIEPAVLADIVRMRNRAYSYPFLRDDIERMMTAAQGDILKLFSVVMASEELNKVPRIDMSDFPVSAFASVAFAATAEFGFEIADGHLHSGGSMPIDVFIQAVAARTQPIELIRVDPRTKQESVLTLHSPTGQCWLVAPLLAGIRLFVRCVSFVLTNGEWPRDPEVSGLPSEWLLRFQNGSFWNVVRSLSLDQTLFEAHDGRMLNIEMPPFANPQSLLKQLNFIASKDLLPVHVRTSLVLGLLRAIVAVHSFLTCRVGEGLTRFSERFAMLGGAKGAARDPEIADIKTQLLASTIKRLAPTEEVVGLEFRSTVDKTTDKSFKKEVVKDLATHCDAFASVLSAGLPGLALSMPVGFRRMRASDRDPAAVGLSELATVLAGVNALSALALGEGGARRIEAIWSIDVADDELGSNNWPYCIGAQLLEDLEIDLKFTIHCGESFYTELNGVRRVGELYLGSVKPYRIGHALALSERASSSILSRTKPAFVLFDGVADLAWLSATRIDTSGDVEEALYQLLTPPPGITPLDVSAVVEAFVRLHDLDFVKSLFLTNVSGKLSTIAREELQEVSAIALEPRLRSAMNLVGAVSADEDYQLSRAAAGTRLDAYNRVAAKNIAKCREHVFDLVRKSETILEACPTSNILLSGMVGGHELHPAAKWVVDERCQVSVSSDDPFLFSVTVLDEFAALRSAGVDEDVLHRLAATSVECCSGGRSRQLWGREEYRLVGEALRLLPD